MLLQFQVYGTTTSATSTIGLTSAKGANTIQQVILLKTHVAFFALTLIFWVFFSQP
jgi:hypothetical protein